eukprot:4864394-Pleurochrysis_carterae.AAC.1
MRLWTGELMNWARIHMNLWIEKKNENKASVQRRWDNKGKTLKLFMRWKRNAGYGRGEHDPNRGKGVEVKETEGGKTEKAYGIKHWGRVRTVPRMHLRVKHFLQKGIG